MASQPSNFLHSIVTSVSRSSSKRSRIHSGLCDFRQAASWFTIDFSMKNEVPRIFSKNIASNAIFHADSESELSLIRISFQTWDIQHRTCKSDRFRHPTRPLGSFSPPHLRSSPHEIASFCRVSHDLQTGVYTNADHYILTWEHQRLSRQTDFFSLLIEWCKKIFNHNQNLKWKDRKLNRRMSLVQSSHWSKLAIW